MHEKYFTFSDSVKQQANCMIDAYKRPQDYNPDDKDWICVSGSNAFDERCTFHVNDLLFSRFRDYLECDDFYGAMLDKKKKERADKESKTGSRCPESHEWEFRFNVDDDEKHSFRMKEHFDSFGGWSFFVKIEDFPQFLVFFIFEFAIGLDVEMIKNAESILTKEESDRLHEHFFSE